MCLLKLVLVVWLHSLNALNSSLTYKVKIYNTSRLLSRCRFFFILVVSEFPVLEHYESFL